MANEQGLEKKLQDVLVRIEALERRLKKMEDIFFSSAHAQHEAIQDYFVTELRHKLRKSGIEI